MLATLSFSFINKLPDFLTLIHNFSAAQLFFFSLIYLAYLSLPQPCLLSWISGLLRGLPGPGLENSPCPAWGIAQWLENMLDVQNWGPIHNIINNNNNKKQVQTRLFPLLAFKSLILIYNYAFVYWLDHWPSWPAPIQTASSLRKRGSLLRSHCINNCCLVLSP